MNARVITVQWKMDHLDEAIRFFREEVATALGKQPGFANTRMLVDQTTGKGMMVTVWANEADLKASEANGFLNEQLLHLSQFFATPPAIDRYEISVNA